MSGTRIARLKLVNFIGIRDGMGRNEIEIDFNKAGTITPHRIVLLKGGNGSGKSTLMSTLSPFKDTFDNHKTVIIDGMDGVKEIDIEFNGHLYEIVHNYPADGSGTSFIKKDGVELNPSGKVKSCEETIIKEFGITKDYYKIGNMGPNTTHFVNLKATGRNEYIGTFLNIEEIVNTRKIVNEKYKALKSEIEKIAKDLKNYSSKEVLENEISSITKTIDNIEEEINSLSVKQGELNTIISRDTAEIGTQNMDDLLKRKVEKELDIKTNSEIKKKLEGELSNLDKFEEITNSLDTEIRDLESDIKVINSQKSDKYTLLTDAKNKVNKTKLELSSLGNPENIVVIEGIIEKTNEELEEIKERIKLNKYSKVVHTMKKSNLDITRYLNKFTTFVDFIEKYYNDLGNTTLSKQPNIRHFFETDFDKTIASIVKQSRDAILAKKQLIDEKQKLRDINETHICKLENLDKRPKNCSIDDCPFIKDALEHKDVLKEIEIQDAELCQLNKDYEELNAKADSIEEVQTLYKTFSEAFAALEPRANLIYHAFLDEKELGDWLSKSLSDFQKHKQEVIENVECALEDLLSFSEKNSYKKTQEDSLEKLKGMNNEYRKKFEDELKEYEDKVNALSDEYSKLEKDAEEKGKTLDAKRTIREKYNTYASACSKLDSAQTMLSNTKSAITKLEELLKSSNDAKTKLNEVNEELVSKKQIRTQKNSDLISARLALGQVSTLSDRLTELNKVFKPTEKVWEALDPKKGIQSKLVEVYLKETENITNELLDVAYGGEFKIHFVITDKEFNIQVLAKGNIKPDIEDTSQGEKSLTTLSISLALIEQSIGDYNVLCLDEIDGPLDIENRELFIQILESQMDKLGIQQVFVISHNSAFDAADMDLVLLKKHGIDLDNESFMENKNVIFNYYDD